MPDGISCEVAMTEESLPFSLLCQTINLLGVKNATSVWTDTLNSVMQVFGLSTAATLISMYCKMKTGGWGGI